jgi:cytohesin
MTVADVAASESRLSALSFLAAAGALPAGLTLEDVRFQKAVVAGGADAAAKEMTKGANPAKPMAIGKRELGFTPMAFAMEKGDAALVTVLLDGDVSPDAPLWVGGPAPLDVCALSPDDPKKEAMARFLVSRGADAAAWARPGSTPLHRMAANGWTWAMGELIDGGAEVNAQDACRLMALGVSTLAVDVVRLLLGAGANPDARREDGGTVLHECARKGLQDQARLLLEAGADANAADGGGFRPLGVMAMDDDFLELLLAHGADPDARRPTGGSALHECVAARNIDAVRMLLGRGADPNLDKSGRTPLRMAVEAALREPALDGVMAGLARELLAAGADPDEVAVGGRVPALWMRKPTGGLARLAAPDPDDGAPLLWMAVDRPEVRAALLAGGATLVRVSPVLRDWPADGEFPLMLA